MAGVSRGYQEQVENQHCLVSFAVPSERRLIKEGWNVKGWMLDSGAFTAWKLGKVIDLDEYIAFVKEHKHLLDGFIALDVIPGAPGRLPTKEEADTAYRQTLDNIEAMESVGLNPIPVYHQGEPIAVLDHYVEKGYELIALGATESRGKPELIDWLLPLFQRHPGQKFHGLAMTQQRLIRWLPFWSVDSTTWLCFQKYGVDANVYLLKNRTPAFYRSLGVACLMDTPKCPEDAPPAVNGLLPMFQFDPQ